MLEEDGWSGQTVTRSYVPWITQMLLADSIEYWVKTKVAGSDPTVLLHTIWVRSEDSQFLKDAHQVVAQVALQCPKCGNNVPERFLFLDVRRPTHEIVATETVINGLSPAIVVGQRPDTVSDGEDGSVTLLCQAERDNGPCNAELPWRRSKVIFR